MLYSLPLSLSLSLLFPSFFSLFFLFLLFYCTTEFSFSAHKKLSYFSVSSSSLLPLFPLHPFSFPSLSFYLPLNLYVENENETMILIMKKIRGEERHIRERKESSKYRIKKVSFWLIYTHTAPQARA